MKKLLLSIVLLATSFGYCQEEEFESPFKKGRFVIGGNLSVSQSESESESEFNGSVQTNESENKRFNINPSLGYFFKDNVIAGVSLGYYKNKYNQKEGGVEYYSRGNENYSLAIYLKKYYKLYKRFYFHVSGDARASFNDVSGFSSETQTYSVSINPGLSWALNKNLAVQVGFDDVLGYRYSSSQSGNNKVSSNSLFADLGNSTLSVGFRYFL